MTGSSRSCSSVGSATAAVTVGRGPSASARVVRPSASMLRRSAVIVRTRRTTPKTSAPAATTAATEATTAAISPALTGPPLVLGASTPTQPASPRRERFGSRAALRVVGCHTLGDLLFVAMSRRLVVGLGRHLDRPVDLVDPPRGVVVRIVIALAVAER